MESADAVEWQITIFCYSQYICRHFCAWDKKVLHCTCVHLDLYYNWYLLYLFRNMSVMGGLCLGLMVIGGCKLKVIPEGWCGIGWSGQGEDLSGLQSWIWRYLAFRCLGVGDNNHLSSALILPSQSLVASTEICHCMKKGSHSEFWRPNECT